MPPQARRTTGQDRPFARRCRNADPQLFTRVHEKTAALTEEIAKVEKEIDDRVAGLYGLV